MESNTPLGDSALQIIQIQTENLHYLMTEAYTKRDNQYHAVVEVIAAMKSNRGSIQQWIKELESALNIEEMQVDNYSGRAPQ
jgi:protein associated with RNAse G/E